MAERLRRGALVDAGINRVVSEPLRLRKLLRDDLLQPRAGRRGAAFAEEREAFTGILRELFRETVKKAQRLVA